MTRFAATLTAATALFGLATLPGCPFTISSVPLEGTIAAEAWTLEQGEAWPDDGADTHTVTLYPELYVDCLTPPAQVSYLELVVPGALGEHDLGEAGFTFVFVAWEDGGKVEYDPVQARVEVIEVGAAGVTAAVHARHSDDHEVDGRFVVPLCE